MNRDRTILILDDEVISAMSLKAQLEIKGYAKVLTASNYEAAMEIRRREQPTMVIVDINLQSDKSGLDFLREAGRMDRVIILSGYGEELYLDELRSLHYDSFLEKPVRVDTVVDCLE